MRHQPNPIGKDLLVVDNDTAREGDPEDDNDRRVHLLLVVLGAPARKDATVGWLGTHTRVTGGAYRRGAVASDGVVAGLLVD